MTAYREKGTKKQSENMNLRRRNLRKNSSEWDVIDQFIIAIYVRVSTEEQAKHGYSINFQIEKGLEKAGIPKKTLTKKFIEKAILDGGIPEQNIKFYIDEGHTGEVLNRPDLDRLRIDMKDKLIKRVICYDPDRLSRKLVIQLIITEEIDKHKVDLIFVNGDYDKTPEGIMFYQFRGAIAEFDKQKINRQLSEGRRKKAKEGKVLRDYKIFGYDYEDKTSTYVINEEEAAVVRLIFDLCTRPHEILSEEDKRVEGLNGIALYLMRKKIRTKNNGTVWHRQVVRQILKNTAYIGEFYQNKWDTEGSLLNKYRDESERIPMKLRPKDEWILTPVPQIIERAQFEHVQKILEESRRRWANRGLTEYLLSGIVRCGECGNTMGGVKAKSWGKVVYNYCCHKNTAGAKNRGCGRKIPTHILENEVWNTVHQWLNQPDEISATMVEESKPRISFEESEIKRIENEINKAKNARKRLLRLFASQEDAGFDEEEVRQELREWKDKENHLMEQLDEVKEKIERNNSNIYSQQILSEAVEYYLSKNPDELTFDDKQQLIRQVVREVKSFNDHVEIYTF